MHKHLQYRTTKELGKSVTSLSAAVSLHSDCAVWSNRGPHSDVPEKGSPIWKQIFGVETEIKHTPAMQKPLQRLQFLHQFRNGPIVICSHQLALTSLYCIYCIHLYIACKHPVFGRTGK